MKSKVLLSTLLLGGGLIALSSYKIGPAHSSAGNRSGSNGSASCAASGCHGSESSNLALTLTLTDDATSVVAGTEYTPGHTYTVSLKGVYSGSSTYTHLGFQASAVNASNANIGTIVASLANTGTSTNNTGGILVVEHTTPIAKTGSDYIASFKWTAPAAGAGTARIYARMLANNNNNSAGDDTPNSILGTFTEKAGSTSIDAVSGAKFFNVYPNPATNNLLVKLTSNNSGKYQVNISSIDGKSQLTSDYKFDNGAINIDISRLSAGIYNLSIQNKEARQAIQFVKK